MKTDGVCPKCARYYSTTNYNEEEAFLDNILAPANEEKCSYHGQHDKTPGMSGHSEESHHYQNRIDDQVPFFRNAPSRPNKKVCEGCKKEFDENYPFEDCEICGSKVFKKRIKL